MYRHTANGLDRPVNDDVRKLRTLADDLERIAAGHIPSDAELGSAARLSLYELVKRPVLSLYGLNEFHPNLVGDTVQTTQIWVLNEEQGWARTYSRYYKLGPSLKDGFSTRGLTPVTWLRD